MHNQAGVARVLLEAGADVNVRRQGGTALIAACNLDVDPALALGRDQGPTCHQAGGTRLGLEAVQGPPRIPDVAFRGLPRFSQEALVC